MSLNIFQFDTMIIFNYRYIGINTYNSNTMFRKSSTYFTSLNPQNIENKFLPHN